MMLPTAAASLYLRNFASREVHRTGYDVLSQPSRWLSSVQRAAGDGCCQIIAPYMMGKHRGRAPFSNASQQAIHKIKKLWITAGGAMLWNASTLRSIVRFRFCGLRPAPS
jgi:hypothetical protein